MLPDPEALIRRSGAAAPLLNAVRERNARDAVRSCHRAADRRHAILGTHPGGRPVGRAGNAAKG